MTWNECHKCIALIKFYSVGIMDFYGVVDVVRNYSFDCSLIFLQGLLQKKNCFFLIENQIQTS